MRWPDVPLPLFLCGLVSSLVSLQEEKKIEIEYYRMKKEEEEQVIALARKAREAQEKTANRITEEDKERINERVSEFCLHLKESTDM